MDCNIFVEVYEVFSGAGAPKGSLSAALGAAFGGCALHRPAGLVMRELSPQATEGEKMLRLHLFFRDIRNFWTLSPSHGFRRASPLPEGGLARIYFFDTRI